MTLVCLFRTLWGTLTMSAFWVSLGNHPLVVFDGHRWEEGTWLQGDRNGSFVEWQVDRCTTCGKVSRESWRRWYGA